VVDIPQLRTLIFGIPAVVLVPEGVDPLFGSGFLFVTASAAKRSVETVFVQSLLEPFSFHDVSVLGTAMNERVDAHVHTVLIDVNDKVPPQLLDALIPKLDHLAEF